MQATKAIREKGYSRLIIAVTANAVDDDVLSFEDAGVDMVLLKPLSAKTLDALVDLLKRNGCVSRRHEMTLELRYDGNELVIVWSDGVV